MIAESRPVADDYGCVPNRAALRWRSVMPGERRWRPDTDAIPPRGRGVAAAWCRPAALRWCCVVPGVRRCRAAWGGALGGDGGGRFGVLLAHGSLVELADAGFGQFIQEEVALGERPLGEVFGQVLIQLGFCQRAAEVGARDD